MFIKWTKQIFIHFGHIKSFPKVSNTHLVVSHIHKSDLGIISFGLYCNKAFFNNFFNKLLVCCEALLNFFIQSLSRNTLKINIKIKS